MHPHVQYSTSHIHSVRPLASRSSPLLRRSLPAELPWYFGRLLRSKINSMMSAGADRAVYRRSEVRVKEERNIKARERR